MDLEVTSFLRGVERARLVARARTEESLALYLSFPLDVHDLRPLNERTWTLRRNLTAYDAPYVALAEALDAPLLTLDGALARAVLRHTEVTVVGL